MPDFNDELMEMLTIKGKAMTDDANDPYLTEEEIKTFWNHVFANGLTKNEAVVFLAANKVASASGLRQSQLATALTAFEKIAEGREREREELLQLHLAAVMRTKHEQRENDEMLVRWEDAYFLYDEAMANQNSTHDYGPVAEDFEKAEQELLARVFGHRAAGISLYHLQEAFHGLLCDEAQRARERLAREHDKPTVN
jgi:hypothetical protein